MSDQDIIYNNLLPPLSILNDSNKKKLVNDLNEINFNIKTLKTAWDVVSKISK